MTVHDFLLGTRGLDAADLGAMGLHFLMLSLLAIGGAITTAPDMQRYLVRERGWLDDTGFNASIALAQSAPGPNVLFVAVIGFNIAGLVGALVALAGSMLPSTTLALAAGRYLETRRDAVAVKAFTAGLAPMTLGLLLATGWVLLQPQRHQPAAWALVALTVAVTVATKLRPLWVIGVGAAAGAMGWV